MAYEEVEARLREIIDSARSCVIPLFTSEGKRRGFRPAGSALLVEHADGVTFAATAGHVLDHLGGLPLLTWGTEATGLIELPYGGALTSQPAHPKRDHDQVDLAAFRLDRELSARILSTGATFFHEERIHLDWNLSGDYVAIGFPQTPNKVKRRRDEEDSAPEQSPSVRRQKPYVLPNNAFIAPGKAAPDERYAEVDAHRELNFVLEFRHQDLRDTAGQPYPNPRGMSGGAIFRIGTKKLLVRPAQIEVAGIVTEYHEKRGLMVAASAPALRHLLDGLTSTA